MNLTKKEREFLEDWFLNLWKNNFNTIDDEEIEFIIRKGFKGVESYTDEELLNEYNLLESEDNYGFWHRQIKAPREEG